MRLSSGVGFFAAREPAWAVSAALFLVSGGCATSDRGPVEPGSELATAVVVQCTGVDSSGDLTAYPQRRVFLEAQGWWGERKADLTVPRLGDAEHLHVAMCFPLQDTISGVQQFRVRVMGHNLPVGSIIKSTGLHDPALGDGHNISFASIAWNDTIKVLTTQFTMWGSAMVDTKKVPSGTREFRILTTVVRPPEPGQTVGAEIHVSSGWCWKIRNGGTLVDSGTCATLPLTTMGRGWYDCFEYKIGEAREWAYPWSGVKRSTNYQVKISGRDGAGVNNTLTSWSVRLDPKLHAVPQDTGKMVASGLIPVTGKLVTINNSASPLSLGMHTMVVISSANQNKCTVTGTSGGIVPQNGEVSAIQVIPFKMVN